MLICIDIGNTHVHHGLVASGGQSPAREQGDIPTAAIEAPDVGLRATLVSLHARHPEVCDIAFCSVVPATTPLLLQTARDLNLGVWQLTHETQIGVPITYPVPAEIGQDRLANAAGAAALGELPAIVIDLGTAVTFDIVSQRGGYEGGIITPGPALMTRYLHEKTAQLPLVEDLTSPLDSAIGKSTVEAMRIGAVLGFSGVVQACVDQVSAELTAFGEPPAHILTSGGASALVAGRLRQPVTDLPDLTLRGLAAAWALNRE